MTPPQHTCLGLLIVEARREATGDAWQRISTCYGRTAAAQATPAGGASNAPTALDLAAHHLESRQDARADDMHLMTACLGRSVYEVTPVYEEEAEEAPQAAGGDGAAAAPRRPRRSYAPPPACAGIELLQVMRASAAAEAGSPAAQASTSTAPARRPWPAAPAASSAATTTTTTASSADELAAFGRRFASRAEKNAAAMYKLLSDIGTGLVRGGPPSRED
jgi:hypothetical protein